MTDATMTTAQLEMRWIEVTDERGRTHMECRWVQPNQPVTLTQAA